MVPMVKKYRLSTTISPKHWSLLKKYTVRYETQQKALEKALENLDNGSMIGNSLSEEDVLWLRMGRDLRPLMVIITRDQCRLWVDTADIDKFEKYADEQRPIEFAIEYIYQKPLKTCSLQEVVDCIVLFIKMVNSADTAVCTDAGDCYEIYICHTMGINNSKMMAIGIEHAIKSYGAKVEVSISERSIFLKVYKNSGVPDNGGTGA